MRNRIVLCCLLLGLVNTLTAQSIFEEATQGVSELAKAFDLGGYIRSTLYVGRASAPDAGQIKSGYGEFSLKLKADKRGFGSAFVELRIKEGQEFDKQISLVELREAYVDTYVGQFDLRFGHQIVVWGRADGINPTDNITPRDMLARSPNEDDRRLGNFLLRATYNAQPVRIEGIWIPFYKSSRIPTELISFPPSVVFEGQTYPTSRLENSAFALKVNLELASFEGSISYFDGHNPFPGLDARVQLPESSQGEDPLVLASLKSYRMSVIGGDFSTAWGSFGLRGEVAYRKPHESHKDLIYVIQPDLHYALGIDKGIPGFGDILVQYLGRYVPDFNELTPDSNPALMPLYSIALKNRLLASQQFVLSHAISLRFSKKLLHETLTLEVMAYANLTSQEYLIKPKLTYVLTDAMRFNLGGEWYQGAEGTLFELTDSHLSAFFGELKLSF